MRVDHRGLVDHEQVGVERILGAACANPPSCGWYSSRRWIVIASMPVASARRLAARPVGAASATLREPMLREVHDRLHDRGLADAGAAGDHDALVAQRGLDGAAAAGRRARAWSAPRTRGSPPSTSIANGRAPASRSARRPACPRTRPRHRGTRGARCTAPRSPSTSRTTSPAASSAASRGGSWSAAMPSSSAARADQLLVGKVHVAVLDRGLERVQQAGLEPLRRVARDAELRGDRVGGAKPDAPDLVREPVRVLRDDVAPRPCRSA